jgi:hypothetical protein
MAARLQLEPRPIEAHNYLAQLVWMRTGDLTQASAALDRALQAFPDDQALWAAKGVGRRARGAGTMRDAPRRCAR